MSGMTWQEAYAVGSAALHADAQQEWDAYIDPVADHPELREITVGAQRVQVPVEQVSQQLQAMGIDPTSGWY